MIKRVGAYDIIPEEDLRMRIKGLKRLMAEGRDRFFGDRGERGQILFYGDHAAGHTVVPADEDPLLFIKKGTERARAETTLAVTPGEG